MNIVRYTCQKVFPLSADGYKKFNSLYMVQGRTRSRTTKYNYWEKIKYVTDKENKILKILEVCYFIAINYFNI